VSIILITDTPENWLHERITYVA